MIYYWRIEPKLDDKDWIWVGYGYKSNFKVAEESKICQTIDEALAFIKEIESEHK